MPHPDVPDSFKPAGARHRYVYDNDIGSVGFERAVGGRGIVGLGDDVEIALVLQDAPVALPDDRMVIDQQDRDALGLGNGHVHQAASGIVAATLTPRLARAIDSEPPSAATRSRTPVRPKPSDCSTLAASPPPSSSTRISSAFSAPV